MHSSAPNSNKRLPSLDGWRAVCIIGILGAHTPLAAGFPGEWERAFLWLFDGYLRVRVFFVISGFIITWLMLAEYERSGTIRLGAFYFRRALRILPVYGAFLLTLALLQWFTPYEQTAGDWLRNLSFTSNFSTSSSFSSTHLWSLAVEEQFFLLWPAMFLFFGCAKKLRLSLFLLAVPVCIAPITRSLQYLYPNAEGWHLLYSHRFSPLHFFDALALGAIFAMLLKHKDAQLRAGLLGSPRAVFIAALTLILTPHVLRQLMLLGPFTVPFASSAQCFGFAVLIVQSVIAPSFGAYPLLNHWLVCRVGLLSYSLYIWQQLFCTHPEVFGLPPVWWMTVPFWVLPAIAAAFLSYHGLEVPFEGLRKRFRR